MILGFADSFPSESIQPHSAPGLAVSVVFPIIENQDILEIPVPQFKTVNRNKKALKANIFAKWLNLNRTKGLRLHGFMLADSWESATKYGIKQITDLPDSEVIKHHNSYRLRFGESFIDLPHAIALQYYFFAMHMGCLKIGMNLPVHQRNLLVLMDRFPGADTKQSRHENNPFHTPGMQLLDYMQTHASTWSGIRMDSEKIKIFSKFGNLNIWKPANSASIAKGKTHPHFNLPDWLNHAVLANTHYEKYVAYLGGGARSIEIADALKDLCLAFKEYDIWMMEPGSIEYVRPSNSFWEIPKEALEFINQRITKT